MLATPVMETIAVPPPLALTIADGTMSRAIIPSNTGIAPGRAKLIVQPIHLKRRGTITRGSVLQ